MRAMEEDFLDEMVREATARNPEFPALLEAASQRLRLAGELAELRRRVGLTQQAVADRMETSQSTIARIEAGRSDVRLSTVERYASVLGRTVSIKLHPIGGSIPDSGHDWDDDPAKWVHDQRRADPRRVG